MNIKDIILTDEDRERWKRMDNDDGRRAMKHLSLTSTERLKSMVAFVAPDGSFDRQSKVFVEYLNEFGEGTNPSWLQARIGATLYDRGAIDENEVDRIME